MKSIPAQEIKRKGISAVDGALKEGPVHVIKNNRPQYVILSEARYEDLLKAEEEAYEARIKSSLEDLKAGRVKRFKNAAELLKSLDEQRD